MYTESMLFIKNPHWSACSCGFDTLLECSTSVSMETIHVSMLRQPTDTTSCIFKIIQITAKSEFIWIVFLALTKAVLDCQNSAPQLLLSSNYLLTPLLKKHATHHGNPRKSNDRVFHLKMKASTMANINSKWFYRSKAAPEIVFVRPLYVKSKHFDPEITQPNSELSFTNVFFNMFASFNTAFYKNND